MTIEWTDCDVSRKEFWEREELERPRVKHPLRVWHVLAASLLVSAGVFAVVVWIGVTLWKW